MTNNPEIRIVKAEVAPHSKIEKRGSEYGFMVRYTLENGNTILSYESRRLKRDAVKRFAEYPKQNIQGMTYRHYPDGVGMIIRSLAFSDIMKGAQLP